MYRVGICSETICGLRVNQSDNNAIISCDAPQILILRFIHTLLFLKKRRGSTSATRNNVPERSAKYSGRFSLNRAKL